MYRIVLSGGESSLRSRADLYAGVSGATVVGRGEMPPEAVRAVQVADIESTESDRMDILRRIGAEVQGVLFPGPAATTVRRLREMRRFCRDRGLRVQVGYPLRYDPALAKVIEVAGSGVLGALERTDVVACGLDARVACPGCHLLDYLTLLLGAPCAEKPTGEGDASRGFEHCPNVRLTRARTPLAGIVVRVRGALGSVQCRSSLSDGTGRGHSHVIVRFHAGGIRRVFGPFQGNCAMLWRAHALRLLTTGQSDARTVFKEEERRLGLWRGWRSRGDVYERTGGP